jgi:uncharacterized membrane protein (DUF485 family)
MTAKRTQEPPARKLSWQWAAVLSIALTFGPLTLTAIAISLSGANLLDGLFGIYTNTPLQGAIITWGTVFTVAGPLSAIIFTAIFITKRNDLTGI